MKARLISSRHNPRFKALSSLLKSSGVRRSGTALLSGPRAVGEVLRDFPHVCASIVLPGRASAASSSAPEGVRRIRLTPDLFEELDAFGTRHPLLVVRTPDMPFWKDEVSPQGCTLFIPFQDPANVGTVIRSAAGFGASRVVVLEEAAHPFHPKALRAGGSAGFRIPIRIGPSIGKLEPGTLPVIGLRAGGRDLTSFRFPDTFGLIPGLEGPGIPQGLRLSDEVGIPMEPGTESLNAALAAGIALYAWRAGRIRGQGPVGS